MALKKYVVTAITAAYVAAGAQAAPLNLSQKPLYVGVPNAPMVMLTMSRDHTLYYEAYNDATDLTGDGSLNTRYITDSAFTYYGYFDSFKCYTYSGSGSTGLFKPFRANTNKTCGGAGEWSGDFLNYVTTARIDALRKVLYGGKRVVDTATSTVLERTRLPNDAHSWGRDYDPAIDSYDIRSYTPLSKPSTGRRHLFANTSWGAGGSTTQNEPLLLVLQGRAEPIWEWVSREQPVAWKRIGDSTTVDPTRYTVRVEVCTASLPEDNCKKYPDGNFKPTGLLHRYGETDEMQFGLISGSYEKNISGGVLRKPVSKFSEEIDANNGRFKKAFSGYNGIVEALDAFRILEFKFGSSGGGGSYEGCGLIVNRPLNRNQCRDWGNPVAELMYETLRYFAGAKSASSSYAYTDSGSKDSGLGLKQATWNDPYEKPSWCTPSYNMVISGINPSYDTDELPGANSSFQTNESGATTYASYSGSNVVNRKTGSTFSATTATGTVSGGELDVSRNYFIGESLGDTSNTRNAPTPKTVSNLANARGMSPEEPTKGGGFYAAGVAHFGRTADLHAKEGDQNLHTYVVALSSPLPQFRIPVAGQVITLVPYGKSVKYGGLDAAQGKFQPTLSIVDFYIENWTAESGAVRINFEDVEQGYDHDMDMIVRYEYKVKDVTKVVDGKTVTRKGLEVTLRHLYQGAGIEMHAGYVISGTDADGIYLEVAGGNNNKSDVRYYLDTIDGNDKPYPNNYRNKSTHPLKDAKLSAGGTTQDVADGVPNIARTRSFFTSESTAAEFLKSPLWYAAKWGGYKDSNKNGLPDSGEWDSKVAGQPDNYFPVTNASELASQLRQAFEDVAAHAGNQIRSIAVSSGSLQEDTLLYTANFESGNWSGEVAAYDISGYTGPGDNLLKAPVWSTNSSFAKSPSERLIATVNGDTPVVFNTLASTADLAGRDDGLSAQQVEELLTGFSLSSLTARLAEINKRINFLRGDRSLEGSYFRTRSPSTVLGDIVDSAVVASTLADGTKLVSFGANDGMLHVLDAKTGKERFSYIPSPVFANLHELTRPSYAGHAHRNYVNAPPVVRQIAGGSGPYHLLVGGLGSGGQGIYALDLNQAANASPATVNKAVKWEFTDKHHTDLGYTYGHPVITKVKADDRWVVLVANGYNNSVADFHGAGSGKAVLFVLDADSGALLKAIDTGAGSTATPNGLATPFATDYDNDGYSDLVYAGDLEGNLWAFDLRGGVADWKVVHKEDGKPAPLFTAKDREGKRQSITTQPGAAYHPDGGLLVVVGTGKYLEDSDNTVDSATPVDSFYALWHQIDADDDAPIAGRSLLQQQEILYQLGDKRITSSNSFSYGGAEAKRGWYLDLIAPALDTGEGERLIVKPQVRFDKVGINTFIPSLESCSAGGQNWWMELDLFYGKSRTILPEDFDPTDADDWDKLGIPEWKSPGPPIPPGGTIYHKDDKPPETPVPNPEDGEGGGGVGTRTHDKEPKGRQSWLQLF